MPSRPPVCTGLSAFPLTPVSDDGIDAKAFTGLIRRLTDARVDSITGTLPDPCRSIVDAIGKGDVKTRRPCSRPDDRKLTPANRPRTTDPCRRTR